MSAALPLVRRLRHALSADTTRRPRWAEHSRIFERAVMIVRVYYVITLYLLYDRARALTNLDGDVSAMDLMWPVFWLEWTGLALGGKILVHIALAAGLLGAVAWRYFAVRAFVSLALLLTMAHWNSYGALHHSQHEWFWISVCFLFLPSGRIHETRANRAGRMQFLLAFGAAPALILLFYSMSGAFKVYYATIALATGQVGGFHPEAMANTVAWRAMQTGSSPLWAEIVINTPWLGWPLYIGLYFVELVAFAIFFRPILHRIWGVILIAFHFGTVLFMDIPFPLHVLINGLLFVLSPFAPERAGWREAVAALPLVGALIMRGGRCAGRRSGIQPSSPHDPQRGVSPGAEYRIGDGRHGRRAEERTIQPVEDPGV